MAAEILQSNIALQECIHIGFEATKAWAQTPTLQYLEIEGNQTMSPQNLPL